MSGVTGARSKIWFSRKLLVGIITIISLFLTTSLVSKPAFAETELTISPTKQTLELTPGEVYAGKITLINSGDADVMFEPIAGSYFQNEDGSLDYSADNRYTNLAEWITFSENEYSLAVGESVEIEFTITVPDDASGGGHYAAIYAQIANAADGLNAFSRIGSLLLVHVDGEINESGELLAQKVPGLVIDGTFNASTTIENTGNVDFDVTTSLTVTNLLTNQTIHESYTGGSYGTQTIYPGVTRTFVYNWHELPSVGVFEVSYTVTYLDQEHTITKWVWAVPFWLILVVIGILFVIVILGWMAYAKWRKKG